MKKFFLLASFLLLVTACASSKIAIAPTREQSSTTPSSPEITEATTPKPLSVKTSENSPTVLRSTPSELAANPNKTFIEEGLKVDVLHVQVLPTGVGLFVKVENMSEEPVQFYSALSTVILGSQQLEHNGVLYGEFSSEIYPGVMQQGRLMYSPVDSYSNLDPQQVNDLKWAIDIGSEDVVIELKLRSESTQALTEGASGSSVVTESDEPFNAEIFDPPSNCRTGSNVNSSVKQALQRGDVLVDRVNTRSDDKGGIWYREKYLDCWIHESQLRFK